MVTTIKAIETHYNGYRFRSLEPEMAMCAMKPLKIIELIHNTLSNIALLATGTHVIKRVMLGVVDAINAGIDVVAVCAFDTRGFERRWKSAVIASLGRKITEFVFGQRKRISTSPSTPAILQEQLVESGDTSGFAIMPTVTKGGFAKQTPTTSCVSTCEFTVGNNALISTYTEALPKPIASCFRAYAKVLDYCQAPVLFSDPIYKRSSHSTLRYNVYYGIIPYIHCISARFEHGERGR